MDLAANEKAVHSDFFNGKPVFSLSFSKLPHVYLLSHLVFKHRQVCATMRRKQKACFIYVGEVVRPLWCKVTDVFTDDLFPLALLSKFVSRLKGM